MSDNTEQNDSERADGQSRLTAGLGIGKYANAVKSKDGQVESFTIKTGGVLFRCNCTGNVFHKPYTDNLDIYECNSCGAQYASA